LYPKNKKCHLEFKFSDIQEKLVLSDQAAIHVFQLPKWKKLSKITSEKDRWLCLFKEGKKLDLKNPPEYFQTKEMRQVMKVLKRFSERERDALMYQHRLHQMTKEQTFLNMSKKARKAFKERDSAFLERDSAFLERDSAYLEKNKAVTDRNNVIVERNNVIVERDNAFAALKEKENEINKLKNKLRKS
jgi:hypothetical protein